MTRQQSGIRVGGGRRLIVLATMIILLSCTVSIVANRLGEISVTIFGISIPSNHIKEIATSLDVEPKLDAIERAIDAVIAEGNSQEAVFKMLGKIEPKTIRKGEIALQAVENASECFGVEFYQAFNTLTLDRMFCFDKDGIVVFVVESLELR